MPSIRTTLHDGLKLPAAFRRAGLQTDLFDATDAGRLPDVPRRRRTLARPGQERHGRHWPTPPASSR